MVVAVVPVAVAAIVGAAALTAAVLTAAVLTVTALATMRVVVVTALPPPRARARSFRNAIHRRLAKIHFPLSISVVTAISR